MVTTIVSAIFKILLVVSGVITLLSLYYLRKYRKVSDMVNMPPLFSSFYRIIQKNSLLSSLFMSYENDISLIYNSQVYAKIYVTAYTILFPCFYMILLYLTTVFTDVWYIFIGLAIVEVLIPYLILTNRLILKSRGLRTRLLSFYELSERYFSDGKEVVIAFREIANSSTGSTQRLLFNFLEDYHSSDIGAYTNLARSIGDQFGVGYARQVLAYDREGIDPCKEIRNIVKLANQDYSNKEQIRRASKVYKRLVIVVFAFNLVGSWLSNSTAESLGQKPVLTSLTTVVYALVVLAYIYCLYAERG